MYNEMRDFKHDYLKIYSSMSVLISQNKTEELNKLFNEEIVPLQKEIMSEEVMQHTVTLFEDGLVQGLLYSYILKAKNNNIRFTIDEHEKIKVLTDISSVELCRILGIFLDNAFEEAEKSSEKTIELGAMDCEGVVTYIIKNSCFGVPDISKISTTSYTSKGGDHGRGLNIARKICDKYPNICLNISVKGHSFIVEIICDRSRN